ncbi:phospholipid-binding protein [Corynebacterium diphtheriae]|uniref:YbhB/YbcL family Raf kinase inhibitor-like protein n=1 Tax=Corynebacterium diphtheriae TaxID=1717 RepID=UPI000893FE98|nr:YbhB/YbcL family Raf kinase inhibitor-like protein [Corynebacterium diphtheriae]OFI57515.1 phospholipid-binding protein [Corynebacterium diphtheriae]OFI64359.1 phospholipid-binding protein [Corynebacterium diphtheriae]OOG33113.1 phospholipid-binding protein [Corynebacterium diphtheriae]OSQ14409.1 phospholipid-binding protein [Corynebacterium diphtheriae]OWX96125.1 phospholipid-binding protein [Corynebacterium diphtheriae]
MCIKESMTYSNNHDRFSGADPYAPLKELPTFPLHSEDFSDGEKFNSIHLGGNDVSPHLEWSTLPEGTKSIAITCFDPDAPTASGFWHWAVFNIPVSQVSIAQGAANDGSLDQLGAISLRGDSGKRGYYGPNPPAGHGSHRYLFAVHAVDVESLDVDPDSSPAVLGFNLYFHSLGRAIRWGWYENS